MLWIQFDKMPDEIRLHRSDQHQEGTPKTKLHEIKTSPTRPKKEVLHMNIIVYNVVRLLPLIEDALWSHKHELVDVIIQEFIILWLHLFANLRFNYRDIYNSKKISVTNALRLS